MTSIIFIEQGPNILNVEVLVEAFGIPSPYCFPTLAEAADHFMSSGDVASLLARKLGVDPHDFNNFVQAESMRMRLEKHYEEE